MRTMTGYERMMAAMHFKKVDKVPVSPLLHYASAHFFGKKVGDYATDPAEMAKCSVWACRQFDFDCVCLGTDVVLEGEAVGCKAYQPEDAPAYLVSPIIKNYDDLDRMSLPDPQKAGRMPIILEATEQCKKMVKGHEMLLTCANGPINNAGQLRGISNLMFDMIDNPEFVNRLLDYSLEISLIYAKSIAKAGADIILLGEALASPNFISPDFYINSILPRQAKFTKAMRELGVLTLIHICGNIHSILPYLNSTHADCLDIDCQVNISEAIDATQISARGNISPSSVLVQSTPDEVKKAVKAVIDDAKNKTGFILGTGCDVSPCTPEKNMHAFAEAARLYGNYEN